MTGPNTRAIDLSGPPVLEITDATLAFGDKVLWRDLQLSVHPHEFIAVIGLSGAGKSTFLRSINGTNVPTAGALSVLGQDVASLKGRDLVALRQLEQLVQ